MNWPLGRWKYILYLAFVDTLFTFCVFHTDTLPLEELIQLILPVKISQCHADDGWRLRRRPSFSKMVDLICSVCSSFCVSHQICVDGVEMERSTGYHKHVPYGVCTGDDAITFEEDDTHDVDETAQCQLVYAVEIMLEMWQGGKCTWRSDNPKNIDLSAITPYAPYLAKLFFCKSFKMAEYST